MKPLQKHLLVPWSPSVFKLPGRAVDTTSSNVFDTEFRLHSLILNIHSAYYKNFLDSTAPFRYNHNTAIDEERETWVLN